MSDASSAVVLALSLAAGAVFALGWFPLRAVLPRLRRLDASGTPEHGALVFAAGLAVIFLVGPLAAAALGEHGEGPPSLRAILVAQSLANAAALLAMWLLLRRDPGGLGAAGVRRHEGPPALLVAVSAWLAFLPFLLVVLVVNHSMHDALGWDYEMQAALELFLGDPSARASPLVWIAIAAITPLCEEFTFRGVLYGGLRRRLPAPLALGASAVIFGLLHDPSAFLPVAALGALLGWVYERTGSLLAPCLVHALHNLAMLIMVTSGLTP